ncbi:hypothetical protein C8J56DRAFT_1065821 [Mycena floridula]|nr:hypothetical protein C8J56DRAFT_1065821 [Mycena floridula]
MENMDNSTQLASFTVLSLESLLPSSAIHIVTIVLILAALATICLGPRLPNKRLKTLANILSEWNEYWRFLHRTSVCAWIPILNWTLGDRWSRMTLVLQHRVGSVSGKSRLFVAWNFVLEDDTGYD